MMGLPDQTQGTDRVAAEVPNGVLALALAGVVRGRIVDAFAVAVIAIFAVARVLGFLTKFAQAFAECATDAREATGAKDDEDNDHNDDGFYRAKTHTDTPNATAGIGLAVRGVPLGLPRGGGVR
jgi:hypothetical protein